MVKRPPLINLLGSFRTVGSRLDHHAVAGLDAVGRARR